MRKSLLATVALSVLVLAGCGAAPSNSAHPTTSPTTTTNQATSAASSQSNQSAAQNSSNSVSSNAANTANASGSASAADSTALKAQEIDLTVLPGEKLGPDGKKHDTFSQTDLTVVQGVPVKLTVYNYDDMPHSVTAPGLNLNLQAAGSKKDGVPGVTTVTFTPTKTGDFNWQCIDKCDGGMTSYSMTHEGYMKGVFHVVPQSTNKQYIDLTIKDGLKYAAADGKMHDSYSPADFTVQKGIPVVVTVTNFDTGEHSMYSQDLNLMQTMKAASKEGVPSVTTFTFTPTKTGQFTWRCTIKCDGGMSSYAMTHEGYMMGIINVVQ